MQSFDLAAHGPISRQAPSAEDVRAELERILSSPHLQAGARRRAFLRYIVEETLEGRAGRLKGYTVAVAVFGRDDTFDPQADPVVRLEARRLRRDLDSYYVDAGRRDAVRITIPKGSYIPHFEWHETMPPLPLSGEEQAASALEPPARGISDAFRRIGGIGHAPSRRLVVAVLVATAVIIAAAGWILTSGKEQLVSGKQGRGPGLVVLPFEALSSTEGSRYLANGISQELISNLMRFPGFRLYTLPIGFENHANPEPAKLGRDLGVAYVVKGSVRAEAEEVRVATQMYDAQTGQVLWSGNYNRPLTANALIHMQSYLAGEIATVLGQPYGVVQNDLKLKAETPEVSNVQSYLCVLRAYDYRRSFARDKFDPVLRCLEEAVRRDPAYADAWAMLGWLHLDAGRIGHLTESSVQVEYAKALEATSQAVKLAPNNALALKALAAVNHYRGRYDDSERLTRQALELNPHDPEALAQLGWRLAVRGKFEEGIPNLKRAIERTVNPPGWYFHLLAIDLYLKRDYGQMLQVAERSVADGRGVSQALIAIAAGELRNRDAAQQALRKMWEFESFARDPAAYFRRHGATDQIVNALMTGLQKAHRIASMSSR